MKVFEYGDSHIATREMTIGVSSMIIGVGILQLPRLLANATLSSDGWISILMAGAIVLSLAWFLGKFAVLLRGRSIFAFTAQVTVKPVAYVFASLMALHFSLFTAYEVRIVGNISKHYLFEYTPLEFVSLCFLWVVVYAVSGKSVGLLRLNTLFLPIVLIITVLVSMASGQIFHLRNLMPFFISDWKQIAAGAKECFFSLFGFEIIIFYTALMRRPCDAPKAAAIGVIIPIVFYLLIYIVCIGIFTQVGLKEITYPTLEFTKEAQIPGEFLERLESIFFTVWVMTLFNSAAMTLDVAVRTLMSIFPNLKRMRWLFILAPCIYVTAMIPVNEKQMTTMVTLLSYSGISLMLIAPTLLYFIATIRGVKGNAQ